jgi:2-methylcitrate dehydratase PrpD
VRLIQGFTSQAGIQCAQLAQAGITGPHNFIEGIYGYLHLYAKDRRDTRTLTEALGERFHLEKLLFKKYPSCGGTLVPTDCMLALIEQHSLTPQDVARVDVTVSPHVHKLVGQPFSAGQNAKVNAQFNIRYCIANALVAEAWLRHFDEAHIRDRSLELSRRVHVFPTSRSMIREQDFDRRPREGHHATGRELHHPLRCAAIGNPMSREEHLEHFRTPRLRRCGCPRRTRRRSLHSWIGSTKAKTC